MGAGCCKEEALDFNAEGKGAFGKVRVVQHKNTNVVYALKYINKLKCIKMKAIENVLQERKLLEEIEHPFICNLRYAFQDDENLFFVLDLMLGGDLRFHLDRIGSFKEDLVKFYVAELSTALAYLHSHNIVHRDLKPDNVLLDQAGHAHLTDFNIAIQFKPEKPLMAVAGSMAYMAPEILKKRGYFSSIDWWSLGVVAFELLFGKRPFRAKTNEALTHAILHDEVHYSESMSRDMDHKTLQMLKGFLNRDINRRLGTKEAGGFNSLKAHPFFSDIDWEKLEKKEVQPPFVPDSKRANFDATHELEELLLEDNPLRAKPRKKNKDGQLEERVAKPGEDPAITKELNNIEKRFIVYDFTKKTPMPVRESNMSADKISIEDHAKIKELKDTAKDKDLASSVDPLDSREIKDDGKKLVSPYQSSHLDFGDVKKAITSTDTTSVKGYSESEPNKGGEGSSPLSKVATPPPEDDTSNGTTIRDSKTQSPHC